MIGRKHDRSKGHRVTSLRAIAITSPTPPTTPANAIGATARAATRNPPLPSDRIERSPPPNVPPHGFGAGIMIGASVEGGIVGGCGANASAGAGVFSDEKRTVRIGTFAGAGAFVGLERRTMKTAHSADPVDVVGIFAGAGLGAFVSNAASAEQLKGIAQTYSLNVGVGPLKLSVQVGTADGTYVGSISIGPGIGIDVSRYPTQSVTRSW